jgi:hypothetical protein
VGDPRYWGGTSGDMSVITCKVVCHLSSDLLLSRQTTKEESGLLCKKYLFCFLSLVIFTNIGQLRASIVPCWLKRNIQSLLLNIIHHKLFRLLGSRIIFEFLRRPYQQECEGLNKQMTHLSHYSGFI